MHIAVSKMVGSLSFGCASARPGAKISLFDGHPPTSYPRTAPPLCLKKRLSFHLGVETCTAYSPRQQGKYLQISACLTDDLQIQAFFSLLPMHEFFLLTFISTSMYSWAVYSLNSKVKALDLCKSRTRTPMAPALSWFGLRADWDSRSASFKR